MNKNRGFIHIILAIVVIVLILTFFRFNLRALVESDAGQSNFSYLWELLGRAWHWLWSLIVAFGGKLADLLRDLTK